MKRQRLQVLRQIVGLMLISIWPAVVCGEGPTFDALLRDGRSSRGVLTGDRENGFQFQSTAAGTVSLDNVQSLELPQVPRSLPDRAWKRLTLVNGDVWHARHIVPDADHEQQRLSSPHDDWRISFSSSVKLPLASIAEISNPPGTRSLVDQDFENDAIGWLNRSGENIVPHRGPARSGVQSLQWSPDEPVLRYELPEPLERGWLEFSFFLEPDAQTPDQRVVSIQFADGQARYELPVTLMSGTAWYDIQKFPEIGTWQRQMIARRPGWHTLMVAFQPGLIRLSLDDFPLAEGKLPAACPRLVSLNLTAANATRNVRIDDFSITQQVAPPRLDVLDRDRDQVDLVSGDQLFGKLIGLDRHGMTLQSGTQAAHLKWSELFRLHCAIRPTEARSVIGRQVQIELQPWNNISQELISDLLSGAIIAIDSKACTVDHPLCGQLTIPWQQIRLLRPTFFGRRWTLEGRPFHLGDEVKSALQTRIPDGKLISRQFEIEHIPDGTASISLTAVDLEPAGEGTLDHPWLKRLQSGELTSELWVNKTRISVLNTEVTGRGTASQPQRLRIKVPPAALLPGQNRVEIRLKPSRGAGAEYDDWELRDWRFEIETQPGRKS